MRGTGHPDPSSPADAEAAPATDWHGTDHGTDRMAGAAGPTPEFPSETAELSDAPAAPETGVIGHASQGVAAPAVAPPLPQTRARTKGVADIIFLIDISGSMMPCIDALRRNIEIFIDSLSHGDPNNAAPVRDWRSKVVGYRDIEVAESEGLPWIVDNPFVRDAGALKAQLAALRAAGGGDEPESLLDALFTVASIEAMPKGSQSEDPGKWRYRSDAAHVVIVFTDASFKETMSVPAAKGGSLQDVANCPSSEYLRQRTG